MIFTAIDLKNRWAFTDVGGPFKIVNMFDMDGDDTSDPDEVVTCVVETECGWYTLNVSAWDTGVTLQ